MEATEHEVEVLDEGMAKFEDEAWECSRCVPRRIRNRREAPIVSGDATEDVLRDDVSDLVAQEGVVHYEIRCESCDTVIARAVR